MSRLSKLQKRTTRVITCSKFNGQTELLFKSLKLLKLEDLLSLNVLKLYYKLCHGDLPVYITNLFTRIVPGSTHGYDLRPSGILKTPTVHTCVAERCVRFMLPKIIKDADPSIIEKVYMHYFQGFTNYVRMICYSLSDSELLHMPTRMTHSYIECLCSGFIIYKAFLCCHFFKFTAW